MSNSRAKGLGSCETVQNWKRWHDLLCLLFRGVRAIRKQLLIASSKLSFSIFIPIISPLLFWVSCAYHPHERKKKKNQASELQCISQNRLMKVGFGFQVSSLLPACIPFLNFQSWLKHKAPEYKLYFIYIWERIVKFTYDKSEKFIVLTRINPFCQWSKQ